MKQDNPIAEMIWNAVREVEDFSIGGIGEILAETADNLESLPVGSKEFDIELIQKIQILKNADENKDIGWMEYTDWNDLPEPFKRTFESVVDPLLLGSVYFVYSVFMENIPILFEQLSEDHGILVLKEGRYYRFISASSDIYSFSRMNPFQFRTLQHRFDSNVIYVLGKNNGEVFVKKLGEVNEKDY